MLLCGVRAAGSAPHSGVCGVQGGREGGHAGGGGGQVQLHADGVLHLQRDRPPQLPQGTDVHAAPSQSGGGSGEREGVM